MENGPTWKSIDTKTRNLSMAGLIFAMLITCLYGTIVSTCGPVIAADLNGTELYAWMITAYMLCETIMIPISGKMSDHYGRKPLFLIGLGIFVGGSITCADHSRGVFQRSRIGHSVLVGGGDRYSSDMCRTLY